MDDEITRLVEQLAACLLARGMRIATAESCTGGFIAKSLTDRAGSSGWFDRGFVTYSNEAKQEMLGVDPGTLARFGAVSEPTAREMAAGALARSRADIALSVTGIAGPGGGTAEKPVGLVWFGWALKGSELSSVSHQFPGDRDEVRRRSVVSSLKGALHVLGS